MALPGIGTAVLLTPTGYRKRPHLEFSLTKDGSTPTGATQILEVTPSGVTTLAGSPISQWGATWIPADVNASTFGVLVRRPDSFTDEALTTTRGIDFVQVIAYSIPPGGSFTMPDRLSELQLNLVGKETTRGTTVTPNTRLKAVKTSFQTQNENKEIRYQGDLVPGQYLINAEASEASVDGIPTYDELGVLLASIVGKPVTTSPAAGVYRHEFFLDSRAPADVQTYTIQYGDSNYAEQVACAIMSELQLTLNRKDNPLKGKMLARRIVDQSGVSAGANDVQTITIVTAPTSFRLRYKGAETGDITVSGLNSATLQTAIQGLSTVGSGNMTVSGSGPFVVTAAGALAGKNLPLLEVSKYTGGSSPSITVAHTTQGGYTEFLCEPIQPGNWSLYYAATQATLGANKLTRVFSGEFMIGNRFAPFWVLDAAQDSWANVGESAMSLMAKLTLQADSIASAMAADARARTQKWMRLEAVGNQIATSGYYFTCTIECPCQAALIENFREEDGNVYAREISLGGRFDPTAGRTATIVLINSTASY